MEITEKQALNWLIDSVSGNKAVIEQYDQFPFNDFVWFPKSELAVFFNVRKQEYTLTLDGNNVCKFSAEDDLSLIEQIHDQRLEYS